jgi:hypothetical protein
MSQLSAVAASPSPIINDLLHQQPGYKSDLKNIYTFFSSLSPLYISAYLLISSISNGDIGKAGMFFSGIVLVMFLNSIISVTLGDNAKFKEIIGSSKYKHECNFVNLPYSSEYMIPNLNSTLLAFIFTYIIMPMQTYNSYNIVLLSIVGVFFGINAVSKTLNGCTTLVGVLISSVVGFIIGFAWYSIVMASNPKLLFFSTDGGEPVCSRPSKQTFKCKVYKNGEVIHTT